MIAAEVPNQAEAIRAQLRRILDSGELSHSPRLKDFLTYVVEEALAGRAHRIKGTTVAQAVFEADSSFDADANSAVRVQAGRLRRRLTEYYAGPGQQDPIVIGIPKGAYAPSFTENADIAGSPDDTPAHRADPSRAAAWRPFILGAALVLVAIVWFAQRPETPRPPAGPSTSTALTPAAGGEAQVLFRQAFEVLMPPQDGARMDAAIGLFERVTELSPRFAGGYTGQSLALAFKVLFLKSDAPQADLREARSLAQTATELNADYGLAHATQAIVHALGGDSEDALRSARRAIGAPRPDPNAQAMTGLALLVAGHAEDAKPLLTKALQVNPDAPRTPYLNLLGLAQFVTGEFETAAATLEANVARGGPAGPHMDVITAANYGRLGREFEGRAVIDRLARQHPGYPARQWLGWYIHDESKLDATMQVLEQLGHAPLSDTG